MESVRVTEGSTHVIAFDLLDQADAAVPDTLLTEATLTLFDWETGAGSGGGSPVPGILNGRDAQDVLNDNDVTIDTVGHVIWTMQPDDNVIVTARRQVERHRAQFHFVWPTGEFWYELEIEVVNLRRLP